LAVVVIVTGCKTSNQASVVPISEDFTIPPDDPRYNQPPESGYTKPPTKKAWGSQSNGPGSQSGMGP
jgi:hypothetical protein